jgi:Fe-S cluster assembly ATP-binding protein
MSNKTELKIENLYVAINGKPILRGVNLTTKTGEIHALMGPNGSGKSTLANVLMGHPSYAVIDGAITLGGQNILALEPNERSHLGLFLAFQYPVAISGVTAAKFLKRALESQIASSNNGKRFSTSEFIKELKAKTNFLEMDEKFINRYLNDGFSGGEKKRMEMLQMLMLKPKIAILDETDSGLDIDAIKVVARGVNQLKKEKGGAIVITHYQRILDYVRPDFVHVFYEGLIVTSGGPELVNKLEAKGYEWIKEKYGAEKF